MGRSAEEIKKDIESGNTALGIEFGSTRIKAVLTDGTTAPIAQGSYEWENRLENGIWTYSLEDIWKGLKDCYADLAADVKNQYGLTLKRVGAMGVSAMMHGYMAFDADGKLLVPFRTWRNTMTAEAARRLTDLFNYNIPQRWSIAHLYQAVINGEEHVSRVHFLTTLAGYVHWKLTGKQVLGVGDASGMFPIDPATGQYDAEMLDKFEEMMVPKGYPWKLRDLLPEVLSAGDEAGTLTEEGAKLLDESGKEVGYSDVGTVAASSSGGSSSGGSSSNTTTTTEKNPDGSVTTTTVNKTTGTVTEVTKNPDGSTSTIETKKDGTVTEINKTADGSTGTTVTDKNGNITQVNATVSSAAVEEAAKSGENVKLPVEVPAAKSVKDAPAVAVTVPKSAGSVKVEIPVEKVTPSTVAILVRADGTEELVKTSVVTGDGVALKLDGSATVKIIDNAKNFTDTNGHWAGAAIDFVTAREMFAGTTAATFTPDANMTRAQMMTVLARFDGEDTTGGSVWYEKGMEWAKRNGVSDGSNPDGNITREQLATMLWKYAGSPAAAGGMDRFPDAGKVADYASDAMCWAVENGLISGMGDGTLNPQGNATRAQLAVILMQYCKNVAR